MYEIEFMIPSPGLGDVIYLKDAVRRHPVLGRRIKVYSMNCQVWKLISYINRPIFISVTDTGYSSFGKFLPSALSGS